MRPTPTKPSSRSAMIVPPSVFLVSLPSYNRAMTKGKAGRNGGGEIKMSDIARHAGVSPMTVSRALREPGTVSEKMRRKVDAAVRQFGYLPNRIAGSLSSKRSNVVGLIVPSIRNSLYASTIQAISDVLRANGLQLMIANSGHRLEDEEALVSALLAQRVCGLILHNTTHSKRVREFIRNSDVPVVETGNLLADPLDMAVSYSNFEAARAMTAHLGRLGYRRIGFVTLPLRDNDRSKERRRAYGDDAAHPAAGYRSTQRRAFGQSPARRAAREGQDRCRFRDRPARQQL